MHWTHSDFDASVNASLFMHDAAATHPRNHIFERDWNGPYVHTIKPGGYYATPRTH